MSRSARLAAFLLVAALPFAALACGGKVIDSGTATDTGIIDETSPPPPPPPPPDTPSTCGTGACSAGESCSPDPCTSCTCTTSGSWMCASTPGCIDAGPVCPPFIPIEGTPCSGTLACPFTDACGKPAYAICGDGVWRIKGETCVTTCPAYEPGGGTSCGTVGLKCTWKNGCGGIDYGYCESTGWSISVGPCPPPPPPPPPPECPKSEPIPGSPCSISSGLSCSWLNSCGSYDYGYCTGTYWVIKSPCSPPPPPPPPPVCPPSAPSYGSGCKAEGAYCGYSNGCGGTITASCKGGIWYTSDSGCVGTCPLSKPSSGSYCSKPSPTACSYASGPSCTSYCFCADDYRWACISYGTGCGGTPPPFDGGVSDVGWAESGPGL